jgi:hypothetical protein
MARRTHTLIEWLHRDKENPAYHQPAWIERSAHTHGIDSTELSKFEDTEEISKIRLVTSDSIKTDSKEGYGTMNSTGVSSDTIGTGWNITFEYHHSREDPVERYFSEMTSVSQLSDLTVLRWALRLPADHLSSEPIRQAKQFHISLALTGTPPLISKAEPTSQIHLSSSDPQLHPYRNQGHRFRPLLLPRVPDWRHCDWRCWAAVFHRYDDLICRIYLLPHPS